MDEETIKCSNSNRINGNLPIGCRCNKNYECKSDNCMNNICTNQDANLTKIKSILNNTVLCLFCLLCIIFICYFGYLLVKDINGDKSCLVSKVNK
jgi:hypothetical protein